MNDLFGGEEFSDNDGLSYFTTLQSKVAENEVVMDRLNPNTKEQAMLGQFPEAVQTAIIDSMGKTQQAPC